MGDVNTVNNQNHSDFQDSVTIICANKHIVWIDSLKMAACIFVFWGHIFSCFYGQRGDKLRLAGFDAAIVFFIEHIGNIFFNGTWWIFIFSILSGVFAARKKIRSFKELIVAFVNRYIRFFVPLLVANMLVLIIFYVIDFPIRQLGTIIDSSWLKSVIDTPVTFVGVIKESLLLSDAYINPLWVLKYIFIGTCIVYIFDYISAVVTKKYLYVISVIVVAVSGSVYVIYPKSRFDLLFTLLPVGGYCLT